MRSLIREFYSKPTSALGVSLVLFFLILAVFGTWIAPYGANEQIVTDARQPPSRQHYFGTDNLGRDVFSRVVLGTRDILLLAGMGTFTAVIIGTILGLFSGYRGGWWDEIFMRIFDSVFAIPAMLLALLLLGVAGPSRWNVWFVLTFLYTPIVARVVRSVVLSTKSRGFVESALLRGEKLSYVLFREILPSVLPALSVEAALRFSYAIFMIASLGFLGLGVQPPSPDWGLMVKEARIYASQIPWAMFFPAGAIALLVIGVNLLTEGFKNYWLADS